MNEGANECIESQAEQPCGPPRGALAAGAGPSCGGDRVQVRPESKAGLSSRAALNPADTEDFGSPAADTLAAAVHLTSCLGRRLVRGSATPGSPHGGPACRFSEHGLDAQRPHGILAVPSVPTAQRVPLRSWWRWAGAPPGREGGLAAGAGPPPGPSSPTGHLLPRLCGRGRRGRPAPSRASGFAPSSEHVPLLAHEGGGPVPLSAFPGWTEVDREGSLRLAEAGRVSSAVTGPRPRGCVGTSGAGPCAQRARGRSAPRRSAALAWHKTCGNGGRKQDRLLPLPATLWPSVLPDPNLGTRPRARRGALSLLGRTAWSQDTAWARPLCPAWPLGSRFPGRDEDRLAQGLPWLVAARGFGFSRRLEGGGLRAPRVSFSRKEAPPHQPAARPGLPGSDTHLG